MNRLFVALSKRRATSNFLLLLFATLPYNVWASQSFVAAASPSRFELSAQPGEVVKRVLTIHNLGIAPVQYNIRSSEWDFTAEGQSIYSDTLRPGSCRPWLKLERRKISVAGQNKRRFRFEFHVPANAPKTECRLAIFVEGDGEAVMAEAGAGMKLPVKGRLAVIVYLTVGDVKAELKVEGIRKQDAGYFFQVSNSGKATGRLGGLLRGTDKNGTEYDVSISSLPVLPGQTRNLGLAFSQPNVSKTALKQPLYPVRLKGELFWSDQSIKVDTTLK